MKKVLVAGELNVDIILQGYRSFPRPGKEVLVNDFEMVLGSASAICAMGLARLGNPVAFLSKVGDDAWGRHCLDALTGRGIDTTRVVRDNDVLATGTTLEQLHGAAYVDEARAIVVWSGRPGAEGCESTDPTAVTVIGMP